MRDLVISSKSQQLVRNIFTLELYNDRTEVFCKANILLQRCVSFRIYAAGLFVRSLYVHGEPVFICMPSHYTCTGAQQFTCAAAAGHTNHHFFGNDRRLQTLSLTVLLVLSSLMQSDLSQSKLAQRREVSFTEKIAKCLFDLFRLIYLTLSQART